MNKQNWRFLESEKPQEHEEASFRSPKITVWCGFEFVTNLRFLIFIIF